MTLTDGLLALLIGVVVACTFAIERRLRDLLDTLNALAEMLGEDIDRRRHDRQ